MGFWWHTAVGKYLQLENDKLCFKLSVADESQRSANWSAWKRAVMAFDGTNGIRIDGRFFRPGECMTVAVVAGDYRQTDDAGRLDFEETVKFLRAVESLMDAAAAV